jgi:3-isopropylmalate/(R)-2-methylmalate dehydratase small subunit
MEPFTLVKGIAAPMLMPNINTDAITPMAAGRSTSVDLGKMLFNNWRYNLDDSEIPDFVLNRPPFRNSRFLVAGANFGCGSSRERAVWALMRFGIRAVIAPSFADIFRDNSYQNGLLPVVIGAADCAALGAALETSNDPQITVDLQRCVVTGVDGREIAFSVPAERREALLAGLDEIDVILGMESDIENFQRADRARRPWIHLDR